MSTILVIVDVSQELTLFIVVKLLQSENVEYKLFVSDKFKTSLTLFNVKFWQLTKLKPEFPNCKQPHCNTSTMFNALEGYNPKHQPINVPVIVIV